jgi:hypothetical protein
MPQRGATGIRTDRVSACFVHDPKSYPSEMGLPDVNFVLIRGIAADFAAAKLAAAQAD